MTRAYFAHPMRTYKTVEEAKILELLKGMGLEVVNPRDYCSEAARLTMQAGGGWLACKVCMTKVMKPLFYRLLRGCGVFVYWNPLSTCGVECEMVEAQKWCDIIYNVVMEKGKFLVI